MVQDQEAILFNEEKFSNSNFLENKQNSNLISKANQIKKISSDDDKYFHFTKTKGVLYENIICDIYYYVKETHNDSFESIYDYLRRLYRVYSVNRENLADLLNTQDKVDERYLEDLYYDRGFSINYNKSEEYYNVYDLLIKQYKMSNFYIENFGLDKFIQINKSVLTDVDIEFIKAFIARYGKEIIKNKEVLADCLSIFIRDNRKEKHILNIVNSIKDKILNINSANYNINNKFIFDYSTAFCMHEFGFHTVKELKCMDDDQCYALYLNNKQYIDKLDLLAKPIKEQLNKTFIEMLKIKSVKGTVLSDWERYLEIIKVRVNGKTLAQAGQLNGNISRERARQVEEKYLTNFVEMINSNYFINLLSDCVENKNFITYNDLINIFGDNANIFKYLFKMVEIENVHYVEAIDTFCYIDGEDWVNELENYIDTLPSIIDENDIKFKIRNIVEKLNDKNINVDYNLIKAILTEGYKLEGNTYTKSKLTLAQKYTEIFKKYFPYPVNIYDKGFKRKFKLYYDELYGENLEISYRGFEGVISRICVLVGRGEYILNDHMLISEELSNKVYEYIMKGNKDIYLTNNLFTIFEKEFENENIVNKYMMQGALKQRLEDKLYFSRDYISRTNEDGSAYREIINFVKKFDKEPVSYKEISNEFIGTPAGVLYTALSQEGIINYGGKYLYVDNIKFNKEDVQLIKDILNNLTKDNQIHHIVEVYAILQDLKPELLEKCYMDDSRGLYGLVEYLFANEFELKRPYFAKKGMVIKNQKERIKEFIELHDEIEINEILEFVEDNKFHRSRIIDIFELAPDYVFKNNKVITRIENTQINSNSVLKLEELIDDVINPEGFIFADDNKVKFPPYGEAWNEWMIYSALNKYSDKYNVILSSNVFKKGDDQRARALIIDKKFGINDLNEFISYLKTKMNLNEEDFENFIIKQGLK